MTGHGNPQGKGRVPVLEALRAGRAGEAAAKPPRQILADYFTTLLVLSAEFAFKPRPGVIYYLYRAGDAWHLSLIAPDEWGKRRPGPFLGRCELKLDMTWQLQPSDTLDAEPDLVLALRRFHDGFVELLDRPEPLEDGLPYHASQLPYYRRVLAAGLASSLSRSLTLSRLDGVSSRQWLQRLSADPSAAAPLAVPVATPNIN